MPRLDARRVLPTVACSARTKQLVMQSLFALRPKLWYDAGGEMLIVRRTAGTWQAMLSVVTNAQREGIH